VRLTQIRWFYITEVWTIPYIDSQVAVCWLPIYRIAYNFHSPYFTTSRKCRQVFTPNSHWTPPIVTPFVGFWTASHALHKMRAIAADGVAWSECLCVCVSVILVCLPVCPLVTFVSSAKTAEPIEMPFGAADSRWPEKPRIRCGQDGTNSFAAGIGDKSAM